MLSKKIELMLNVASTLTAEDLDELRASAVDLAPPEESPPTDPMATASLADESDEAVGHGDGANGSNGGNGTMRGARERARTRESKVSTACLGQPREAHTWWPVGTVLFGRIGAEKFTAIVIENPRVKSNRSMQITSGAASGRICLTPTRAAIEATAAYRQSHQLGRSGGVTNGWVFWTPKP